MEKRAYNWRIVSYSTEEKIKDFCIKYGSKWEYILHNKDIKEDGTPKENHYHINITLKVWKSRKAICEAIDEEQNSFAIEMTDKEKAHRYLTHKDNPEKYQYEESGIKSNFKWEEGKQKQATTEEFLKIAESKELSMREKAILLGRDYIRNYTYYQGYIEKMQWEEISKNQARTIADEVCDIIKWRYNIGNNIIDILEDLIRRLTIGERLIETDEESPFEQSGQNCKDNRTAKPTEKQKSASTDGKTKSTTNRQGKQIRARTEQLKIDEPKSPQRKTP